MITSQRELVSLDGWSVPTSITCAARRYHVSYHDVNNKCQTLNRFSKTHLISENTVLSKCSNHRVYSQRHTCARQHARVVTDLETSCNKVVVKPILGCVRTACSQLL